MKYSTIKKTYFLLEDLTPETTYTIKVRAVNASGVSNWTTLTTSTAADPFRFAIKGATASASVKSQPGFEVKKLVDLDKSTQWHTAYAIKAVPFEITIDLHSFNQLEMLKYVPRKSGFNGVFTKGNVLISENGTNWKDAGEFKWDRNHSDKTILFKNQPKARFVKLVITEAFGHFGSGNQLYIFKVSNTESYMPGDINNDKKIDENDLTSYINYTGLRRGDADFDYVSIGDVNRNGLIDAYDISNVTTKLDGGVTNTNKKASGYIECIPSKKKLNKGEEFSVVVKGVQLKNINALSCSLPYSKDYEYISLTPLKMLSMKNLSYDRLHSNGEKVLYPTFVNVGQQKLLSGNQDLFVIKLKAKRNTTYQVKLNNIVLIGKNLDVIKK